MGESRGPPGFGDILSGGGRFVDVVNKSESNTLELKNNIHAVYMGNRRLQHVYQQKPWPLSTSKQKDRSNAVDKEKTRIACTPTARQYNRPSRAKLQAGFSTMARIYIKKRHLWQISTRYFQAATIFHLRCVYSPPVLDKIAPEIHPRGCAIRRTVVDRTVTNRTVAGRTVVDRTVTNRTVTGRTVVDRTVTNRTVAGRTVMDRTVGNRTVRYTYPKLPYNPHTSATPQRQPLILARGPSSEEVPLQRRAPRSAVGPSPTAPWPV